MINRKSKYNPLVSVIIVNYNNFKYLNRSIKSVLNQSYKKIQLVVVDDMSTDSSWKLIKKYEKKITIFKNKKKNNIGSYDQMNSIYNGFKKCRGKIIFLLDSDDFFKKNKVSKIINEFKSEIKSQVIFDKPIIYFHKKRKYNLNKKQRNNYFIPWPRFSPQSCISVKKEYLKKKFNKIKIKKFPTIWFDFRLAIEAFKDFNKIKIVDQHLTYYQQSPKSAASKYKVFSKNWWLRRKEAHDYFKYVFKKKKNKSVDEFITNLANFLIAK